MNREQAIKELSNIQNELCFTNQDILTITAYMKLDQVIKHLDSCRAKANKEGT